ncbi:bifunctional metallophosphatase/5'-nucleotidase [Lapidilactobacillus mulanensis]|uniref:Bifunctional metallophosphatase/5'-nucleotidase n=1 Tax=Lapidilactobacillus mulanensis TaxID=2485999 RepID=A0ABW4DM08_9LACO|nr:bifunctional UDP-sugar hydrolase/5'-nucleotidase [Lapidilactobacillus mulanensis]
MKLTILSTSDTHGYLLPTDYRDRQLDAEFGLTKAATVIATEKAKTTDPVLVIENGDFLQGSPFAYYQAKVAKQVVGMTSVYNVLPYQVGIVGNHEFNYGTDYLQDAIKYSDRHFLCANILNADGEPAFGQPYEIFEYDDHLKVAVLGLTTCYIPHWEAPDKIAGLTFKSAVETAKKWVPQLHQLADIVVVAYHGGFERDIVTGEATEALTGENEGYELLKHVPGIDALVTGHQHREIAAVSDGVPTTQPGSKAAYVGKITLTLDENKQVSGATADLFSTADVKADEDLTDSLLPDNENVEDWLDQPLGKTEGDLTIHDPLAVRLQPHPYIQFIQDVQRDATKTKISGTALFNNDGQGFGKIITFRSVLTNYIYPNTLAVVKVSGADLRAALEQCANYFTVTATGEIGVNPKFETPKPQHYNYDMYAGINYTIDVSRPVGQRITELTYEGQSIRPEQELEVVVNQYRAVGGGNYQMFTADKIVREVTEDMTEIIADYLRVHPVVKATTEQNFKVIK